MGAAREGDCKSSGNWGEAPLSPVGGLAYVGAMTLDLDPRLIDALLTWQAELGADEYIGDAPVDRFAEAALEAERRAAARPAPAAMEQGGGQAQRGRPAPPPPPPETPKIDPVAESRKAALACESLEALAGAMRDFPHCDLRKGARNFFFGDGNPASRVLVITEAPSREADKQARLRIGRGGALLDLMLDAIGLDCESPDPESGVYLVPVLPWCPPGGRPPEDEDADLRLMQPFLRRHVELADPKLVVLLGNQPCQAVLGKSGISRLRGIWAEAWGRPALPMAHPDSLLRNPAAKREAWADLLSLKARLRAT